MPNNLSNLPEGSVVETTGGLRCTVTPRYGHRPDVIPIGQYGFLYPNEVERVVSVAAVKPAAEDDTLFEYNLAAIRLAIAWSIGVFFDYQGINDTGIRERHVKPSIILKGERGQLVVGADLNIAWSTTKAFRTDRIVGRVAFDDE